MMYPSAIQGHMPFVNEYKKEQIRKVVEKHRSRHHSGPDNRSHNDSIKHKDTRSMPILWQSVYTGHKPKFISMPALDEQRKAQLRGPTKDDTSKKSVLTSLKKFFGSKKDCSTSGGTADSAGTSGAIVHDSYSQAYGSSAACSKKPATDKALALTDVKSAKRQRLRTISNKSTVMETIEEVSEIVASSSDRLSDRSSMAEAVVEEEEVETCSSPDVSNLFFSCGNLSNHTDSSSSQHGSAELICAA